MHFNNKNNNSSIGTNYQEKVTYRYNFASKLGGAKIVGKHISATWASAVIDDSPDNYLVYSCEVSDFFVMIVLTEDILIDTVSLLN